MSRTAVPHFAFLLCATLLAPFVAVAAGLPAFMLGEGDLGGAIGILLLFPVFMLTRFGRFAYFVAAAPTLVLGLFLSQIAATYPLLRRKLVWVASGASAGAILGWVLMGTLAVPVTTAAGAAGAFTYRLIAGRSRNWRRTGLVSA